MSEPVRATFWAQVEATWTWYTPPSLRGIHVRKVTQRRPRFPEPGTVLVKLTISLPRAAFVPPVVEASADVPEGRYEAVPAAVTPEPL
jgi:hypothetical protein